MKKLFIFTGCLLAALALTGFSCGQKTAEKATEAAIEDSTGGQANVNLNNGSMKVETGEGTLEAGEEVELPADFPSDVYVAEGSIRSALATEDSNYSVSIEAQESKSALYDRYISELESAGWNLTLKMSTAEVSSVAGEKDDRIVTVSISESEGKTFVAITVAKN